MRAEPKLPAEPSLAMLPFRIGTTSFIYRGSWLQNVKRLAGRVRDVEILLFDIERKRDRPSAAQVNALAACRRRLDLSYTVHTPLAVSLASEDEARRQESVRRVLRSIRLSAALAPHAYVVHVYFGDRERGQRPADVAAWRQRARKSLVELVRNVPPRRLCVETLDYDFALLEPVVDELDLAVAIDVGHLARDGAPLRDVVERYLPRATVIQWHGTDPNGRDHRSLRFFPRTQARWLIETLCRESYRGVLTLEVFAEHDLDESLALVQELLDERSGAERWALERGQAPQGGGR